MPSIVKKLLIFAAADGLILQPLQPKNAPSYDAPRKERLLPIKIGYKTADISVASNATYSEADKSKGFEAFGIVGLLTVSKFSYLISITRREQVAQIHGKPIFVITEVALTPLISQAECSKSIQQTTASLRLCVEDYSDSDSDTDEAPPAHINDEVDSDTEQKPPPARLRKKSSVAEDVINKKGSYGMFTEKFFSKGGWAANRARDLGITSTNVASTKQSETDQDGNTGTDGTDHEAADAAPVDMAASLLPKLLKTTSLLFGSSRSFFFSYDHDLTRSHLNHSSAVSDDSPLYKKVDSLYFWNKAVVSPFIDAKQDAFVLPLIQGFVGQKMFDMDLAPKVDAGKDDLEMTDMSSEKEAIQKLATSRQHELEDCVESGNIPKSDLVKSRNTRSYLLTLISRRSIKRAGLRYLRRGIDLDGNTANSVETEQILSAPDWSDDRPSYSFLQIRGSIPLFFSQTPYSFKPVPQLHQSKQTNAMAFSKHFSDLVARYGSIQVASLVEKHNVESAVGAEYEKVMQDFNSKGGVNDQSIGFEWFDFHAACRGMKFENVSLLMDTLGSILDSHGFSISNGNKSSQLQNGVLRTNCMDCLDRTNVVQSACARRSLNIQLMAEGIDMSNQKDLSTNWFNTLWADNGDAISKQYASTAALKGDFTRTRKRNYKGALTDMGLSISRFYSGIVNDYFSQASIDFLLGNVTSLVFAEYESSLQSSDPSISPVRIRQQAIDVASRVVIADDSEEFIGGWVMLTPQSPNTIRSMPLEEAILLLTNAAVYSCRFDWSLEKVSSFERISLKHIKRIKHGVYITSTLSPAQADEAKNVGFLIEYRAGKDDITRINTRSLSSNLQEAPERSKLDLLEGGAVSAKPTSSTTSDGDEKLLQDKLLAFKAPAAQSSIRETSTNEHDTKLSEKQLVNIVTAAIEHATKRLAKKAGDEPVDESKETPLLIAEDVISLAAAKRSTGLLDQLGHSLKKLVWA